MLSIAGILFFQPSERIFMVQPNSATLPEFGSVVPGQGGILVAIMRGPTVDGVEQPPNALLISADASSEFKSAWLKGRASKMAGASSYTDGWANTQDMLAAECPPAVRLHESTIDGHNDWYVPSLGEIRAATANVGGLFNQHDYYWTSTQCLRHYFSYVLPWILDVKGGRFLIDDFGARQVYVRPFRRIPLHVLAPGVSYTLPPVDPPIPEQDPQFPY